MAKKKINIVLLLVVLGLWGLLVYRFVKQYNFKNDTVLVPHNNSSYSDKRLKSKDTFEMVPINRDPFLGTLGSKKITKVNYRYTGITAPKKAPPLKKQVPFIEYYGYIKSNSPSQKELVMIKSNGMLLKIKLGEEKEGVKVLKIFKDSIQFSFNKEKYYVRKN